MMNNDNDNNDINYLNYVQITFSLIQNEIKLHSKLLFNDTRKSKGNNRSSSYNRLGICSI